MRTHQMIPMGLTIAALACGSDDDTETGTERLMSGAPSIVVDLDPDSTGMTFTIESIIWVESPMLEGIDGLMFDPRGRLWAAVNEHNALVVIADDGQIREAYKNGNTGPLEFPAALVFVGNTGYVANFDRARADNFAPDGTTSSAGIGASIARFSL